MSLTERIAEKVFRTLGAKSESRQYAASKNNRLVGDWTTTNLPANQEIRYSIKILRARARQLARDDDYFIGFLKDLDSNVIGHNGIGLQVNATDAKGVKQKAINDKVENAFKMWSKKAFCTVTGQDTFKDVQTLALKTLATDGEFLIRLIFDSSSPYAIKIQFLDVDWLDEEYNEQQLPNGNRVVMSVELDKFDRPVAYYLSNPRWGQQGVPGTPIVPRYTDRLRIPAEQIIHRFVRERVGQTRGITWAHGAMMRLNMLGGYEEAELVGARVGASQMGFVTKTSDEQELTSVNANRERIDTEVAPGMIMELPAGYSFHEFTPKRPGNTYPIFVKSVLRAISKSLGVSYNSMASDLESTSYSSMRAGTISERDMFKLIQTWMRDHLLQDIYEKWLMCNMTIVPATKLKDVMYPIWRPRGYDWVDPSKDTRADIDAVNRGIKTLTEILGERGKDFEDEMALHAYEQEYIEKLNLKFNSPMMEAEIIEKEAEKEAAKEEEASAQAKEKEKKTAEKEED